MSSEIENKFLPEAYKSLLGIKKTITLTSYQKKQRELDLKVDYATKMNLRNKKNELETSKVKFPLFELALKLVYVEGTKNKIEDQLEELNNYINQIKDKKVDKEIVESYFRHVEELSNLSKNDLKEINSKFGGLIAKDDYKTLEEIVKLQHKPFEEQQENKFRKDNDLPTKKPKKVNSGEEFSKMKDLASQLGIDLTIE